MTNLKSSEDGNAETDTSNSATDLEQYRCDQCEKETDITGIAYLSPADATMKCSPFLEMKTLCYDCYIPF